VAEVRLRFDHRKSGAEHDLKYATMKPTLGIFLILVGLGVKWMFPVTVFGSAVTQAVLALVFVALGLLVLVVRKPEE
jgi:hypothetical protein